MEEKTIRIRTINNYLGEIKINKEGEIIEKDGKILSAKYPDDDTIEVKLYMKEPFRSGNHESCVTPMEQELGAYNALKKSYKKGNYYDCGVLIANYFGHIDYGKEFGYSKTHEEICLILYETLLASLMEGHKNSFIDFVDDMVGKIEYSLNKERK